MIMLYILEVISSNVEVISLDLEVILSDLEGLKLGEDEETYYKSYDRKPTRAWGQLGDVLTSSWINLHHQR